MCRKPGFASEMALDLFLFQYKHLKLVSFFLHIQIYKLTNFNLSIHRLRREMVQFALYINRRESHPKLQFQMSKLKHNTLQEDMKKFTAYIIEASWGEFILWGTRQSSKISLESLEKGNSLRFLLWSGLGARWHKQELRWLTLLLGPRRRPWHPTPVLLPGKSHGQRSLVGCCPWGR